MRVDKFLKNSRLIKRRTIAKQACDTGRVKVNGKVVKAGFEIDIGDVIEIGFGDRLIKAEVLELKETSFKDDSKQMVRIIE
ncbi:MAG: RNA-binding S4 domain-containing protein [Tissierellia bacterium]|nr:RNA-binding S4 domain-containing protein [Tissierellia bacterium]